MTTEMSDIIRRNFDLDLAEGRDDKVMPLSEAVSRHIRAGQAILIGEFANAATREIARQFRDSNAAFTVINASRDYTSALVYNGLIKKLIGVAYMHLYPTSGPNKLIQKAFNEGRIEIEGWTSISMQQRLIAGAMDMECMVTKSLLGSDMVADNKNCLHAFHSPFETKQELALLKSLNPDIAVVHGWFADRQGNIILGSPYYMGNSTWGARASKEGVVATVEKIVSTEFIRKHSCLVSIPSYMVKSVTEVPFGAHPQGMNTLGLGVDGFTSYRPDIPFIGDYRKTVSDPAKLKAWMDEWVYNCSSQEAYIAKLGAERLTDLSSGIGEGEGQMELANLLNTISYSPEYTRNELTVVAAARKIEEIVIKRNYINFLLGVGFSALAGWSAYYKLKKKDIPIKLMIGTGVYGYSPQPGNPSIGATSNIETGCLITDAFQSYGTFIGGFNNRCLSVLGAAQVDKSGNVNATKVDGQFIAGSGGSNDAANAQEVMVISRQSVKRFVDHVDYITSPGIKVKTLVSDMAVFEKLGADEEFILTGVHVDGASLDEKIKKVKENCGWKLKVAAEVREMKPPDVEELAMIRCFDPNKLYR